MAQDVSKSGEALLRVVDHIYVINLPERTDRRADSERSFRTVGLSHDDPRVTVVPACRPAERGEFPTIGARGCFQSHMMVLERALEAGHARFLVMEDDADFTRDFARLMPPLEQALAGRDWGVLYFWNPDRYGLPPDGSAPHWVDLPPEREVTLAHCVGYSRAVAARMLPYIRAIHDRPLGDPRGGAMHVDGAFAWFRRAHPEVLTLAASEPLSLQRPSRTDIHDLRWWDRLALTRPLVSALRRLKARRA